MKNIRINYLLLCLAMSISSLSAQTKEPVDYVNTRIGNISLLLVPTYPTTHLPNSMLRMIPAYNEFVTDRMAGLPLNVPSHRQGDALLLMPYCDDGIGLENVGSYRYDQEVSTPYHYSVFLDDYGIAVRFVPQAKSGLFTMNFENKGTRYVMVKTVSRGELQHEGNTFFGYELYRGIKHYFYLEFDQKVLQADTLTVNKSNAVCAKFGDKTSKVCARYGVSYISVEQAKKNLRKEINTYDEAALIPLARKAWNDALGKIRIEGGSEDQKTTFYTALYRSSERMVDISEDGKYFSGFDGKVHDDGGVDFWTDDWIWDTHRALHPLQILLNPKAESQKLASYLRTYEQSGWMPTFPCVFGDAHCMNGNHAAVMFADALCKDIPFDVAKAADAMKHTVLTESMVPWHRGPITRLDEFYQKNGWFPALHPGETETVKEVSAFEKREAVAVTLGASYDDWSIAQLDKKSAKKDDYNYFINRSLNYRHLFNKSTNFFHPKDSAGNFIEPFDYIFSGGIGARDYYDENNAWTYNWDVQHNIADLIALFGGNKPFTDKLDQLFVEGMQRSKWQYYAVHPDATGNVGQFVMGNEPSFHIPYLYNYAGQPWKTQKRIRMLMESWFRNDLMGICGDEDGGGMSAFYVFSAMGFYPETPGLPMYVIGSPIFTKSTVKLDNGKTFTVIAHGASWENKYIQSAKLNGRPYNKTWFTHADLMKGGTLELVMGNRPNKQWGTAAESIPPSYEMKN